MLRAVHVIYHLNGKTNVSLEDDVFVHNFSILMPDIGTG